MLALTNARVARPQVVSTRSVVQPRSRHVARSNVKPTMQEVEALEAKVQEAIKEANATCDGGADAAHCAAAWDNVEELSAAASHKKADLKVTKASSDPLEQFCDDNPDADECRVYDD